MKKYILLALVPVVLIGWGFFGATQLTTSSFTAFVNYETPYALKSAPGNTGEALTAHLVIIVMDGLRLDASRQMKNANALRALGADRVMRVGQPSLSLPGWTVIGTGAWQEQHGQTTNFGSCHDVQNAKPVTIVCASKFDSIFLAARRKGLSTALSGTASWDAIYRGQLDTIVVEPEPSDPHRDIDGVRKTDDALEADALKILKEKNPNLQLIYFTQPDNVSHGYGAVSPQTQQTVAELDARLGRIMQAIDLSQTTVFLTADHGHVDQGGHGGPEQVVMEIEFVAAGKGIKQGNYPLALQADIAPTAAVLLGTSFPADSQGDVMFDMLDVTAPAKANRAVAWADEIAARYDNIARVINGGAVAHPQLESAKAALAANNFQAAIDGAQADVKTTRDAIATARSQRLRDEMFARTPLAALYLLPMALYLWLMRKMKWEFKRPLIGALAYFVVYYALFILHGGAFSLTVFNEDTNLAPWFAARTIDAIIALLVVSGLIGILARRESKYTTALITINAAFFAASVLWLQVIGFFWFYGFAWSWFIPDLVLGFKYYLDVLQTGAFMVKSPPLPTIVLMPLIAIGVKWIAEKIASFKLQSAK